MVQYAAATPQAYLDMLDNDWRKDSVLAIRSMILKHNTGQHNAALVEGIQYKMLSFSDTAGSVFALNAQKHYVSLYVGNIEKIDPDKTFLQALNLGKGCIRFSKSQKPQDTDIAAFIDQAMAIRQSGEDIDC